VRVLVAVLLVLFAACGATETTAGSAPPTPRTITGVLVQIESTGLDDVESFTLKAGDEMFEVFIDPQRDYGFPLSHLNAHRTGGEPVAVDVEERDGRLIALTIADA